MIMKEVNGITTLHIPLSWGMANKISKNDYVVMLADPMSITTKEVESKSRPNFVFNLKRFAWDSIWLPILWEGPYIVDCTLKS